MTNIIGIADMREKFRIKYDSDKEAVFLVHTPSKIVKFPESSQGIYALDMEQNDNEYENKIFEKKKKTNISNVIRIEDNKTYFSKHQIKQAEKVRKLLFALGLPTYKELKRLMDTNGLQDSPISSQDVTIAEKIYQKEVLTLKGNSTKNKPNRIIDPKVPPDIREIHQTITLAIDIIYVNNCYFLTTIPILLNSSLFKKNHWS